MFKPILRNWDLPAGTKFVSLFIKRIIHPSRISSFFNKSSKALLQVEMPPLTKGRKKAAADTKSNGISKSKQVEELPAAKIPRSGRLRKMAENEVQEVEPILDEEAIAAAPKKENGTDKEDSARNSPDISEENVNGKVEEPEEATAVPKKRGRKKATDQTSDQNVIEEMSSDAATNSEPKLPTQVEDPEEAIAVPKKRGRKKATAQTSNQNSNGEMSSDVVTEPKEDDQISVKEAEVKSDEGAENENPATIEPEKVPAKRGRKKAVDPASSNQDQSEESNVKQDDVETVAGPSKRSRNIKLDPAAMASAASAEAEEDGDFAPRKTRGRNAKASAKEAAPVARGRKRKVDEEKVKETKKGKVVEETVEESTKEMLVDDKRQLRVDIQRDVALDEMARNSSKEEEDIEKDLKEEEGDGKEEAPDSKAGRKRANKNEGVAKPAKVAKKEAAGKKGASKSGDAPDMTTLDIENSSTSPDGKPWNFKIVSWNINGIRAWLEKDGLLYLQREQPDILCLQETKCSDTKLPPQLKEIEGYHYHWLAGDKDGYSGVGMLFKKEPISIKDGIGIEEHDNEGRVITAEYEKFYLVTSYVPNAARGLTRLEYRMKWDEDFRAYIKKLDEKKPVILCGDLNVAHEPIDLANPKTNKKNAGFTQEERDGFSALLKEGFVDTFRHLYPDTKDAYTFWTYMMNARAKNVGWRLDYFVISERFTDHLCDSVIRKDVFGSDHCPIGLFLHV